MPIHRGEPVSFSFRVHVDATGNPGGGRWNHLWVYPSVAKPDIEDADFEIIESDPLLLTTGEKENEEKEVS